MVEIDWPSYARVYDHFSSEEYAPLVHDFYGWILDRLDEREIEPATIIEIGCGTGLFAAKLAEWYPDATLHLADKNAPMLDVARARLAPTQAEPDAEAETQGGAARLRFHETDADRFLASLPDGGADAVVFCRSWYLVADPPAAARAALRALRPGGMLFLYDPLTTYDVPAVETFFTVREPARWPLFRAALLDFNAGVAAGRYRLYSRDELTALWTAAGGAVGTYESHAPVGNAHRMCVEKR
ncbi:MAG: class I SAM-dependent methyltransferase [Planctomycetes bacterium]|nr:class I SAM-dependent methyltransferase [Planctomycetota bacterium]